MKRYISGQSDSNKIKLASLPNIELRLPEGIVSLSVNCKIKTMHSNLVDINSLVICLTELPNCQKVKYYAGNGMILLVSVQTTGE